MRIAIAISRYETNAGLERVAVEYARGLAASGHEVTVFAQSVRRAEADGGVRFIRVGGWKGQTALRAATFPIAATRAIGRVRPSFDVHLSFGSVVLRPSVVRAPGCHRSWWELANREWPATTVDGIRRRLNPHHRIVLWWDRRVLGRGIPTAVLAAGEWAADDIRRFYPAVGGKVSVLPDGVNLDEFDLDDAGRAYERDHWSVGDAPLLFTLATEQRRKGLDTLFESFRIVRERLPDARLVVGGRVPSSDVRALAVHHRVQDGVLAVGFLRDLRAAYSAADVLVFPTRFDPWGLPVVEALACGTRVAVSARAGAASVVRPGVTGALIADPADPAVVAEATLAALAASGDRPACRASVRHLAWDRVVSRLEEILEQVGKTL